MAFTVSQLGQVSLTVDDIDTAERFYGETLGLRKLFRFGDLVFFDCSGVPAYYSEVVTMLHWQTEDMARIYRSLRRASGEAHFWPAASLGIRYAASAPAGGHPSTFV